MSQNEQTIWVTQIVPGQEVVFRRQVVYLNHPGETVNRSWRAQAYVEDCQRKGIEPSTIPESFKKMHLYHQRRSQSLDELVLLQDQEIKKGDVFVLTELADEVISALVKNYDLPDSIDPAKFPHQEKISPTELIQGDKDPVVIRGPWLSGSFYLFSFCIILVLLGILAWKVPIWALPIILIAAPLIVIVIGLFQALQDKRLGGATFRELLLAVIRSLPLLRV